MTRIAICLGTLLLVVIAWLPAAAQQAPQPAMILPGRAIGSIEIGMSLERARVIMEGFGTVEAIDTPATHGFCNPDRGVGVCAFDRWQRLDLSTSGVVVYILTDDARFATDAGSLKVGQPLLEFLKAFGLYSAGQGTEVRWEGRGLSVDVGASETGIVARYIGVYTPRPVSAMAPPSH